MEKTHGHTHTHPTTLILLRETCVFSLQCCVSVCRLLQAHLKKNKAFRRFKKLQEARPELHNCTLEDLLPLPIQRIQQ